MPSKNRSAKDKKYRENERKKRVMAELMEAWVLVNKKEGWKKDALCREYKGKITWFPTRGYSDLSKPKTVCERCAVKEECLQYALDNRFPAGIWGGKTADERLEMLGLKRWGVTIK
jgi:WhiB family redox-sensing transcriptional regulator